MKYKFKEWISTTERAEVMKIIRWSDKGLIDGASIDIHPELKDYFIPVEESK